ncbi:unnamed protein product [Lepidochelys kempii]
MATRTAPSVFPLVPCCSKTGNVPPDTSLACLVTGYLPSPVDIKWNSGQVTKGVKTFPEVTMSNGLHTQSSLLIPSDSSRQGDPYQCDVMHQGTGKTVSGKFPQESYGLTVPPQVYLLVPTCEDSATESQVELVCLLLSFRPGKADMKWLVNGKERSPPTPAFSSAMGTDGFYMGQSCMTITRQSWEMGDIFTCQVTHPEVGTELSMHNASKCWAASRIAWKVDGEVSSAAKTETLKKNSNGTTSLDITMSNTGVSNCNRHPLEVSLLPPSLEKLYIGQNATISCLAVLQEDGTYSATSILRVCVEEWQAGEEFTCTVKHQDIPSAIVKSIRKSHMVSLRAPSVYISPPHAEELALRESATITCLASGFQPRAILVTRTQQEQPVPQEAYTNIGPVREAGKEERYFIYSKALETSWENWRSW